MTRSITNSFAILIFICGATVAQAQLPSTGQSDCYDHRGRTIACPDPGEPFSGQDAQSPAPSLRYRDNGDGTVTDLTTGLMWQRTPAYDVDWSGAVAGARAATTGGYDDWRLPTIKELYSLIDFSGRTGRSASESKPYLDTDVFDFRYGTRRFIDAQYVSSTEYVSTTMGGNHTVFGVNFADGRIKGYPSRTPRGPKVFHVRYVRGDAGYLANDYVDNSDGTVTDRSTGLMWAQKDGGVGMSWQEALAWVEARNAEGFLGYRDWRLPNAKELQSIVDYRRSPDTTESAAIDPTFDTTPIRNEAGQTDFPYFWTSTTHLDGPADIQGSAAVYVAFGRALGYMPIRPGAGSVRLLDVHGAGAQRSDPKAGDPSRFPQGRGPQGDVIRIDNFVRLVRTAGPSQEVSR